MPDDEEFFDEKGGGMSRQKNDASYDDSDPDDDTETSGEAEKSESEAEPLDAEGEEGLEEEPQGDKELVVDEGYGEEQDEDEELAGEEPLIETPGLGEDRPYTIAQLAQAQVTKKKPMLKTRRISLHRQKEEESEKEKDPTPSMPEGQLAIDVFETSSHIIVKSTIAGVKPEDLDIGIDDNTLNIRGARHQEEQVKGEDYFYQECYWGTFSRSVILPMEVDTEHVEASLKDGILIIKLSKIVKEKEKKIKVITG